jgi:hypothetical protein
MFSGAKGSVPAGAGGHLLHEIVIADSAPAQIGSVKRLVRLFNLDILIAQIHMQNFSRITVCHDHFPFPPVV